VSTENGGNTFLQNTGTLIHNTVQKPKKRPSTDILDHYYYYVVFVVVIALLRGCL
jgi:hypothetical protein